MTQKELIEQIKQAQPNENAMVLFTAQFETVVSSEEDEDKNTANLTFNNVNIKSRGPNSLTFFLQ